MAEPNVTEDVNGIKCLCTSSRAVGDTTIVTCTGFQVVAVGTITGTRNSRRIPIGRADYSRLNRGRVHLVNKSTNNVTVRIATAAQNVNARCDV